MGTSDLQEELVGKSPIPNWINLYPVLQWNKIEKTYNFAASKFGKTFRGIINRDNLFDKCCLIKIFVEGNYSKWKQKGSACENIWAAIFTPV